MSFQFISNPSGRGLTDQDYIASALDQPMSLGSTFFDQAKGGILESFGLGTAIREGSLPEEAPTTPELMITPPEGGEPIRVPDTPQMRRRITVFESVNPQTLQARPENQQEFKQRQDEAGALSEDAYKASSYFRKDIPWQNGMTVDRAAALAEQDDRRKVREFYATKRPITSFFGNLGGQALDPINYIPVFGEAVTAANVARFGRVAGRALTSSLDAAANTAVAGLATAPIRGDLGDDVSWQSTISQIAMAAVIGGAFGAVAGRFGRATPSELRAEAETKLATLQNVQESRIALNDALDGLIHDGEVSVSPASAEVVSRIANVELPKIEFPPIASPERLDQIASDVVKIGNRPRGAQSLMDFLASEGGIVDQAGDLNAIGISRKFIPGRGALVRRNGRNLDNAREAAAQAGFFNHIYGTADEASAKSTVRDLLDMLDQENRGQKTYSVFDERTAAEFKEYEDRIRARDDYREFLGQLEYALREVAPEQGVDDAVLARATDLMVQEKLSPLDAFDRAALEEEARFAEYMDEKGQGYRDDELYRDIPFFDEEGFDPSAGTASGSAQQVGLSGRLEGNAANSRKSPSPGTVEGLSAAQKRVGRPEASQELAEQYKVNPETGEFAEQAEVDQLIASGRVTEEDLAMLTEADETIKSANAYGEAVKAFAQCAI